MNYLESITSVVIAIGTALAVFVALFKEDLVKLWRSPKFNVKLNLFPPDCNKTTIKYGNTPFDGYYFRLWIENIGKSRAENVQVFVSKVFEKKADETFLSANHFYR